MIPIPPVTRARWLLLGAAAALVTGGLVLAGWVTLSTALYAAFIGGMIVLHLFGHGHGALGRPSKAGLSHHSSASQATGPASETWRLPAAKHIRSVTSETSEDDQHSSHTCH